MRHYFFSLMSVLALPAFAHADIPPGPDFVENCTVEKLSVGGRDCRACRTYFGNPRDYCGKQVGADFTHACNGYGASVWTEVWCRGDGGTASAATDAGDALGLVVTGDVIDAGLADGGAAASRVDAANEDDGGCNAVGASGSSLPGLLVLAGWLATRRRRHAR